MGKRYRFDDRNHRKKKTNCEGHCSIQKTFLKTRAKKELHIVLTSANPNVEQNNEWTRNRSALAKIIEIQTGLSAPIGYSPQLQQSKPFALLDRSGCYTACL